MGSEIEQDVRITTPDGVELSTDIHRPDGPGPHPTLLQRTCYGKDLLTAYLGLSEYADAGYEVVFQDCRGTGLSPGEPTFFAEAGDGRVTADWIAEQPWFDGNVGPFGGSYMGFTAVALAATRPPHLKAMSVGLMSARRADSWFPNRTLALDMVVPWLAIRVLGPIGAARAMSSSPGRRRPCTTSRSARPTRSPWARRWPSSSSGWSTLIRTTSTGPPSTTERCSTRVSPPCSPTAGSTTRSIAWRLTETPAAAGNTQPPGARRTDPEDNEVKLR